MPPEECRNLCERTMDIISRLLKISMERRTGSFTDVTTNYLARAMRDLRGTKQCNLRVDS